MATLQVRTIDDRLYEALGRRASRQNRSISQEVTFILKDYLSSPPRDRKNATDSFLELAGTWNDDRSAEKIVKDIRKSRKSSTRFKDSL